MGYLVHRSGDDNMFWGALLFLISVFNPYSFAVAIIAIIAACLLPKGYKKFAFYGWLLFIGLEMLDILLYVMLPF